MGTAAEMLLRQREAERWLRQARDAVHRELCHPLMAVALGRKVHKQRARKLRRRGALVVKLKDGSYRWMPAPFKLVLSPPTPTPPAPTRSASPLMRRRS